MMNISKTRIDQYCEEPVPLNRYFRARFSASRALLKISDFQGKPTELRGVAQPPWP
jgi:hypothetical protein